MPSVVAKITNEDGTEASFGPMDVPSTIVEQITAALTPHEDARLQSVDAALGTEVAAAQAERSAAAEAANQAAIEAASAAPEQGAQ